MTVGNISIGSPIGVGAATAVDIGAIVVGCGAGERTSLARFGGRDIIFDVGGELDVSRSLIRFRLWRFGISWYLTRHLCK